MRGWTSFFSAMVIFTAVASGYAQQQGGPGGGPGGPGGGPDGDGGPPSPEQMRAMMEKRIQQNLDVTEDAWTKLQPLIEKVEVLEHEADTHHLTHRRPGPDDEGNGDGGPGGGGPADENDNRPKSAIETAMIDLKKLLGDKSASDDKIQAATKAVQAAEKKAADDLADARKALKAALNTRQTAVLVAMGLLN